MVERRGRRREKKPPRFLKEKKVKKKVRKKVISGTAAGMISPNCIEVDKNTNAERKNVFWLIGSEELNIDET